MDMKAKDLFEKNISYFQNKMPDICAKAVKYKPESSFVFDDDGEPDLVIRGERMYGLGAKKLAEKQIDRFKNSDVRLKIRPVSSDNLDLDGKKFLYKVMERAVDAGITFGRWNHSPNVYHAVSLGCGLGAHLDALAEETQCQNLIVAEPNYEFFYQSLHCFDWADFIDRLLADGRQLQLVLEDNYDDLIIRIRTSLIHVNPVSYDGTSIFVHYDHPILRKANNYLANESGVLLQGWGYFEDEINMISNVHANLKRGREITYQRKNTRQNFPIFIVGSGPSLDKHLDIIRENAEKAIIVSCGTALRPLLTAGIEPDFHMELERGPNLLDVYEKLVRDVDVSNVTLVASTTCQPKLQEFFPKRLYYFREPLSVYPLFGKSIDSCVRFPSPTVTNVGLSFAQDLGFREYYFFGIDLGSKDISRHHSQAAHYYADDAAYPDFDKNLTFKGNFGGTVYSLDIFSWTKDSLEGAIRLFTMGHTYYNCSDGAAIKGALPKLASTLTLKNLTIKKEDFVQNLIKEFPVYSDQDFREHWNALGLTEEIVRVVEDCKEVLENTDELRTKKYLNSLMNIMMPFKNRETARMIIGGSLAMTLMVGEYYLDRVMEKDKLDLMEGIVKDEYKRMLDTLKDQALKEIQAIDEGTRFEGSLLHFDD